MFKVLKPFYRKQFLDPKTRIGKDQRETMHARGALVSEKEVPLQSARVKGKVIELDAKESAALLIERGVIEVNESKGKQSALNPKGIKGLNGKGAIAKKKAAEKKKK